MAEEAAHRRSSRLGRMFCWEFDLDAVMAGFTEGINLALLFASLEHLVELLVGSIHGEFFGLLRTRYGNKSYNYGNNNADKDPVTLAYFHCKTSCNGSDGTANPVL